jgi:hypothetical protein
MTARKEFPGHGGWATCPKETLTQRVQDALKRPNGVGRSDDFGARQNSVGSAIARLKLQGKAHIAKVGHKTVRWFDTPERAAAYVFNTPKPPKWGVTISGRPKFDPDAPMVITPKTKYTVAPPPPRALYSNTHARW